MPARTLPAIRLRLTRAQWHWIQIGLRVLLRERRVGALASTAPGSADILSKVDEERLALLDRLSSLAVMCDRRSTRLDAIEIAACMLGVRVTSTQLRHGHLSPRCPLAGRAPVLLRRLERARKVAKRLAQKQDPEAFRLRSGEWRDFVRRLRANVARCSCWRPFPESGRRYQRAIFRQVLGLSRTVARRFRAAIAEKHLRKLTSDVLRHVRRGRAWIGLPALLRQDDVAREFMSEYLGRRLRGIP